MTTLAECQAAIDATPTDGICHLPGGLVCCTSAEGLNVTRPMTIDGHGTVFVASGAAPTRSFLAAAQLRADLDAAIAARKVLADSVIAPQIRAGDLTDDEVAARAAVFPDWAPGLDVNVGDLLRWDGTVVEVVQAHRTQDDWTPDKTAALFKVHRTPAMTEWQAGIDVKVGEKLTYQGVTYEVIQGHRTQAGWEPDKVPSLWRAVK